MRATRNYYHFYLDFFSKTVPKPISKAHYVLIAILNTFFCPFGPPDLAFLTVKNRSNSHHIPLGALKTLPRGPKTLSWCSKTVPKRLLDRFGGTLGLILVSILDPFPSDFQVQDISMPSKLAFHCQQLTQLVMLCANTCLSGALNFMICINWVKRRNRMHSFDCTN